MPAFEVSRSTVINAPPEKVFDVVSDYSTWTTWSPWLCADKDATVKVSDDPRSVDSTYHWTGDVVGEGILKHVSLSRPSKIVDEIRFIKPWESRSDVGFELKSIGEGTEISWEMKGSLPWFMFWMKGMMETFIAMDYDRGLRMLKEYIETGEVLTNTEIKPPVDLDACRIAKSPQMIGVRKQCRLDEIGSVMSDAVKTVKDKMGQAGLSIDGDPVSIYHPVKLSSGVFDFTTGYTVEPGTATPSGLLAQSFPGGKAMHVQHVGSYANLGNAWSAAHQVARYTKTKLRGKAPCVEIYRNDPSETAAADLITDIYLPIK